MEITVNGIKCVGTTEECVKFATMMNNDAPIKDNEVYEYIDLDLPSGKKWATCNIGASKPWKRGLYFQWGDIEGRTKDELESKPCSWSRAPKLIDIKNGLGEEYDVVFKRTQGKAHMPSKEDFDELLENTIITKGLSLGGMCVDGYKFTSKKDSSKFIFIPFTGGMASNKISGVSDELVLWSRSYAFESIMKENYGYTLYLGDKFMNEPKPMVHWAGFNVRGIMD